MPQVGNSLQDLRLLCQGWGAGKQLANGDFVSPDDFAKRLEENFGVKCHWTTYLIERLIEGKFITPKDADEIYNEIVQNGFYGSKKVSFSYK